VYVLGKDGSGTVCLLDRIKGINGPLALAIAVDDSGRLWVGCTDGNIHIIEIQHSDIINKCDVTTM